MKKDATALPRLNTINRQQLVLRTLDVERLIDEDHSARLIWELVGRLDLSLYHSQIAALEGQPGRDHTDPQLLISFEKKGRKRGQPELSDFSCTILAHATAEPMRLARSTVPHYPAGRRPA